MADETAPPERSWVAANAGMPEGVRAHWDYDAEDEGDVYERLLERTEVQDVEPVETRAPSQNFVHLHVHSEYSLLDGLSPVTQIVQEVKRAGMPAVSLTDHGNLYGAIDFYSAAKSAGIKPIIGVEAYVSPRGMTDKQGKDDRSYFHLVLLAKDLTGYQNLLQLVTRANLEGYYYKPRIDRALLAEHAQGLIALSACYSGEPSRAILDGDPKKAREAAAWYREVFGPDYFLELQDHGNSDDQIVNKGLLEIHRELGIPLVATNDTHYAAPHQADAQDTLLCIQTNSAFTDPKRMRMQPSAFYLKSPQEMWGLFGEVPTALTNTLEIAERCHVKLDFGRLNFPPLDHVTHGEDPMPFLARTCRERLVQRYGSRLTEAHRERLEYELDIIEKTGFPAYILFVWDFVQWARQQGIPCGPRGSAAGSIILYCLGISEVDPVGYGLTFERFLNPERVQMPDIDMDFADDRRDEVIQYVVDRYGRDRVAQIITFGRLLARAAIRDVGRALGYAVGEVDRVAKLIPAIPGHPVTIAQAVEQIPELKQMVDSDERVAQLIEKAKSIEGVARHAGTHAAGVVVADQPLVNYVPLQKASRGDSVMTQYPQKILDKIGLLKMDFLGLANLTMLAKALDNIRQTRGESLNLDTIPYDDVKTYAMLGRGETKTVFQLEGSGMTRYIQELKPVTVDHLAAMVALYRPGPMAHIPSYIARREGRESAAPPDPSLEDVLKESYGIIVYQDQVLQVVRKVAGYSLGQADVLRRAMGKKDKDIMAEEGPKFIGAAQQYGYSRQTAEHLWDLLQPFAGYAFNKAHAYCYAFLAYQTAYLKANYPVEWFAAVLTTICEDTDKVVGVINECRRLGAEVLGPNVNQSRAEFTVEQYRATGGSALEVVQRLGIRFGLCAIKNVGTGAVESIVKERDANGPYRGLDDFCRRLDLRTINKRVIESLIKSGALDSFGPREALLKGLDAAMGIAQKEQKAASSGQVSLFDAFGGGGNSGGASPASAESAFRLPLAEPVPARERAAWEKEVLGFHFADHPFKDAAAWLRGRLTHDVAQIGPEIGGEKVTLGGVVTAVRKIYTKTKGQMAVLTVEDLSGGVEVVVFPRAYERSPELYQEEAILIIEGKVDTRDERAQVLLERAEEWTPPADGTPPPPPPDPVAAAPTGANGTAGNGNGRAPANGANGYSNGHVNGAGANGYANGHVNGSNGYANGHANGAANGANGHANGANGHTPDAARSASDLVLVVQVPRPDDATAMRVIEQLHSLVERHLGDDRLELTLFDRGGTPVVLTGADVRVAVTPELEAQVRQLVGDGNVAQRREVAAPPAANPPVSIAGPGAPAPAALQPLTPPRIVAAAVATPETRVADDLAAEAAWHDAVLAPTHEDESTALVAF